MPGSNNCEAAHHIEVEPSPCASAVSDFRVEISPGPANQAPPLVGFNAWSCDRTLQESVRREGGGWVAERAVRMGELIGSERLQNLAAQANRYPPELRTHDRFGNRIDAVEYHPAYHELMGLAFGAGLHSLAWTERRAGVWVARAALNYLWNQGENGVACPVTMTFASVKVLRNEPRLTAEWEPKLLACDYDPRPLPLAQKRAVTIGMAMTERQGGSDLRANSTRAVSTGNGEYELNGHKWFCSAPMSDAFFTLAQTDAGLTCFFVPRSLQDGSRNPILIQRLKDKCGNRSNASSEIEYRGTRAWIVGEDGRGIATLIEMAHLTRFDIVVASAGMMRAALNQALHHTQHRRAFGRRLAEQPLMQNVLADLALETEAATLLAFRLARACDLAADDARERLLFRLTTPIAKYWLCKRLPPLVAEAMECLGGNGYVEEAPLARLYREAPLNGIWEGSGNVICLDVLRSMEREPAAFEALRDEIDKGGERIRKGTRPILGLLRETIAESQARRIVEFVATALQASLMTQHASPEAAEAFCASRLESDWGRAFGTLPSSTPCAALVSRAQLDL
jgi:putative acyl-CoA dehydrogenase